jgi:hypothetical protein
LAEKGVSKVRVVVNLHNQPQLAKSWIEMLRFSGMDVELVTRRAAAAAAAKDTTNMSAKTTDIALVSETEDELLEHGRFDIGDFSDLGFMWRMLKADKLAGRNIEGNTPWLHSVRSQISDMKDELDPHRTPCGVRVSKTTRSPRN